MCFRILLPVLIFLLNGSTLLGQVVTPFDLPEFPGRYERAWTRFVGLSPKGTYVLAIVEGNPCGVSIWKMSDQSLQCKIPIRPQDGIEDQSSNSIYFLALPVWSEDEKTIFIPTHTEDGIGYQVLVASVSGEVKRQVPVKRPPGSAVVKLLANQDGSRLAIGFNADRGDDTQRTVVQVLDGNTGDLETTIGGFPAEFQLYDLDLSKDGKRLVTAGLQWRDPDRTKLPAIKIWNTENGKSIAELGARSAAAFRVKLSRDSKALVSAHLDNRLVIWDLTKETSPSTKQTIEYKCNSSWDYHAGYGRLFASDDLSIVGYAGEYQPVAVWRADERIETLLGIGQAYHGVALSPDGTMLVTGSDKVRAWDLGGTSLAKREPDATLDLPIASGIMRFTSDEKRLVGVAWSDQDLAFSIALGRGKRLGKYDNVRLDRQPIYTDSFIAIDRSVGELLFARPAVSTLQPLNDAVTTLIPKEATGDYSPTAGAISLDGKRLLLYNQESWKLSDRNGQGMVRGDHGLNQAFFSNDDQRLFLQKDFSVLVLDSATGKKIDQLTIPTDHFIRMSCKDPSVVFGTDYNNKSMFRLKLDNGDVDYPFDLIGQSSRLTILGYAAAANADVIVTATSDNRVRVWDSQTGAETSSFLVDDIPCWVGVTSDAKQVYIATYQPNILPGKLLRFSIE